MYNEQLAKAGLFVIKGREPGLPFRFEKPVNISISQFFSGCSVGLETYVNDAMVRENVHIGRYCSIGRGVVIGPPSHDLGALSTSPAFVNNSRGDTKRYADPEGKISVIVGNDVWIGDRAFILAGVTIGDGAAIGAGAVVTRSVPPYGVAYGVPAAVRRYRFDEKTVARLLSLKWHEFAPDELKKLDVGNVSFCVGLMEGWPDSARVMREKKYVELAARTQ